MVRAAASVAVRFADVLFRFFSGRYLAMAPADRLPSAEIEVRPVHDSAVRIVSSPNLFLSHQGRTFPGVPPSRPSQSPQPLKSLPDAEQESCLIRDILSCMSGVEVSSASCT